MKLKLLRFSTGKESTYGALYIGDEFQCFTLENAYHEVKVLKNTRIPEGKYKITLRKKGGYNTRYLSKFGDSFHKGMLYLNDVDNFKLILIHTGNKADHTDGCILVANTIGTNNTFTDGFIGDSTNCYRKLYPKIRDVLLDGEEVTIEIVDYDKKIEGVVR